jgi:XTP/dITP diphosphohydrolase
MTVTKPSARTEDPPRRFSGEELVVATHNKGKLRELRELFGDKVKKLSAASDYGVDAPPETGTTFIENALIKAQTVAKATGRPALADDSGLCVDALNGAPGVYSADWAEEEGRPRDFLKAMHRVNEELGDSADRKAHFVSCLVLAWPDGHYEAVEGYVHGTLTWPPRGDKGFGYDPMFVPDGYEQTYGELEPAVKEKTSHRADAFKKLMAKCF